MSTYEYANTTTDLEVTDLYLPFFQSRDKSGATLISCCVGAAEYLFFGMALGSVLWYMKSKNGRL